MATEPAPPMSVEEAFAQLDGDTRGLFDPKNSRALKTLRTELTTLRAKLRALQAENERLRNALDAALGKGGQV